jgi:2-hydroxychromene-2-carboxylate isomerase
VDRPNTIQVYSDYKSPYAFLAKDLIYELEDQFDVHLEWLPYTLDIPSYLGSARLDERGEVVESTRNAHQWRRVRYSYMDCRRQARKRGLVILGTRKIWDSSLAAIGMLWAKRQGNVTFALITIESLNAFGDESLTLKTPRQLLPYYLKSTPTGLASAVI